MIDSVEWPMACLMLIGQNSEHRRTNGWTNTLPFVHSLHCCSQPWRIFTERNVKGKRAFHRLYAHDGVGRFSYLQVSNVGFAEMWPMKCARKNGQGSFFFSFFFFFCWLCYYFDLFLMTSVRKLNVSRFFWAQIVVHVILKACFLVVSHHPEEIIMKERET